MSAGRRLPFILLAVLGCAHAKTTDGETAGEEGARKAARDPAHPTAEAPTQKPGHPPIAAHVGDLMEPGADDQIRRRLVAKGYLPDKPDAPLADGLRKFQAKQDLPATGVPDHETVRRLGLDPAKIFRD